MEWETDWELRARMGAVLVLLVGLLGAFALALHWVLTDALSVFLTVLLGEGDRVVVGDRLGGVLLAALFAAAVVSEVVLSEKLTGEDAAIRSADDAPRDLRKRLARLAHTADVPAPKLAVAETDVPKAYTTGVLPGNATVVVSSGLLDALSEEQVDAVLAHELAHVKNRDASVMTAASLVELIGEWLLGWFSPRSIDEVETDRYGNPRDDGGLAHGNPVTFFPWLFFTVAVRPVAWVFWSVGRGLTRLLSQYREHAADRGAVAITGSPAALASALAELDREAHRHPETDLRARDRVQSAFYVVPVPEAEDDEFDPSAYTGFAVNGGEKNAFEKLDEAATDTVADAFEEANAATDFPTHPPTGERIERLREMDAETR
ncbi:M48 family metalloprotease [Halorussus salilacus]|uniref:M48 family metalloprotease n=1 Tax=Halorussus salilacus TaxID=2953750 RepID=UPI0020A04BC3|nr:M48 family metalloprotease [Halorussus salilacus]USZ69304.1 M48 family metalloprotease [Halorussus salilacus]